MENLFEKEKISAGLGDRERNVLARRAAIKVPVEPDPPPEMLGDPPHESSVGDEGGADPLRWGKVPER